MQTNTFCYLNKYIFLTVQISVEVGRKIYSVRGWWWGAFQPFHHLFLLLLHTLQQLGKHSLPLENICYICFEEENTFSSILLCISLPWNFVASKYHFVISSLTCLGFLSIILRKNSCRPLQYTALCYFSTLWYHLEVNWAQLLPPEVVEPAWLWNSWGTKLKRDWERSNQKSPKQMQPMWTQISLCKYSEDTHIENGQRREAQPANASVCNGCLCSCVGVRIWPAVGWGHFLQQDRCNTQRAKSGGQFMAAILIW